MRYRPAILMLFAMLPAMSVLAAPVPDPSAILDIGPPPKGKTDEKHRKSRIDTLTDPYGYVTPLWRDPEVRKLPPVAALKDPRSWLAKNLRVTWEGKGNCLRLTFRAGTRAEKVAILNALLRAYIRDVDKGIKFYENLLRSYEKDILRLEKIIASGQQPGMVDRFQKGIDDLRSNRIPPCRAKIATYNKYKQSAVIKWAK